MKYETRIGILMVLEALKATSGETGISWPPSMAKWTSCPDCRSSMYTPMVPSKPDCATSCFIRMARLPMEARAST